MGDRRWGQVLLFPSTTFYTLPMSRPLRIEFPGAIYHVTSRGDRREPIYRDDEDRSSQLEIIAQAMDRFDAQVLAWCWPIARWAITSIWCCTRAGPTCRG